MNDYKIADEQIEKEIIDALKEAGTGLCLSQLSFQLLISSNRIREIADKLAEKKQIKILEYRFKDEQEYPVYALIDYKPIKPKWLHAYINK